MRSRWPSGTIAYSRLRLLQKLDARLHQHDVPQCYMLGGMRPAAHPLELPGSAEEDHAGECQTRTAGCQKGVRNLVLVEEVFG